MVVHSNLNIANKSVGPFLFTMSNNSLYQLYMHSKSSKWELGFVHYIAKFTTSRFAISRFECTLHSIRRRQLRSLIIDLMSMAHVGKWCGQNKLRASIFHSWAVIGMTPRGSNDSKIARVYRSIILLKCCQFRQTCLHLDLATASTRGTSRYIYVYPNICLPILSFILGSKNIGDESCFFVCFQFYYYSTT